MDQCTKEGTTGSVLDKLAFSWRGILIETADVDINGSPETYFIMVFHQPSPGSYGTGSHPTWRYHLTFTWHGMVVEGTDAEYDIEPEQYAISALGLSNLRIRLGYGVIAQLARFSNDSIPLPPADA